MLAAATSATTTAVYFQIRRRCGRAGASTYVAPNVELPVDLVGADDHLPRHLDPEPGRGVEVDRELDLRDLLHRQIGRGHAPEEAVDVAGAGSTDEGKVDPIRVERALLDPLLAMCLDRYWGRSRSVAGSSGSTSVSTRRSRGTRS